MNFTFRTADMKDLPQILHIMHTAYDSMERKDWFVIDTEDYMKEHIAAHGFTMLAIAEDGTIAGFFLIKFPGNTEENLGHLLQYSKDRCLAEQSSAPTRTMRSTPRWSATSRR